MKFKNIQDQFHPNLAQCILGWRGFNFVHMKSPTLFQREIIVKKQEHIDKILKKIFFTRTTVSISTKLSTKHSWLMGIKVCLIERRRSFPRDDNYEISKIHWWDLKIFFSRTTGPISNKLGTMHPWLKGIQVYSNGGPALFQG